MPIKSLVGILKSTTWNKYAYVEEQREGNKAFGYRVNLCGWGRGSGGRLL